MVHKLAHNVLLVKYRNPLVSVYVLLVKPDDTPFRETRNVVLVLLVPSVLLEQVDLDVYPCLAPRLTA